MANIYTNSIIDIRPVTPQSILCAKLKSLHDSMEKDRASETSLALISECIALAEPLENYLLRNSSQPSEALNSLERATNELDWDGAFEKDETRLPLEREMLSGAFEGQFLKMLIVISKAEKVLEIGSFTGYATLAMAEALPENGMVIACEYDHFTAEFSKKQLAKSEHGDKIKILTGDAIETLSVLTEEGHVFDMVFIDADKTNYKTYYSYLLDMNLVKEGGLICVDNTLFMGEVYSSEGVSANGNAIREFNEVVRRDHRVEQVLVPIRDGVTVIRRIE